MINPHFATALSLSRRSLSMIQSEYYNGKDSAMEAENPAVTMTGTPRPEVSSVARRTPAGRFRTTSFMVQPTPALQPMDIPLQASPPLPPRKG